ncbi:MAG: D-ribose pyranase [Peptostreptococcaceae bacterium]|nr:D-ribose pyranase [Peptostreptococcaceae bacterium]
MRKGILLNSEILYILSKLGHKDQIAIGDAGLPIPLEVQRIDLAVAKNLPGFMPVFQTVLAEEVIEMVILAEEIIENSPSFYEEILKEISRIEVQSDIKIQVNYIPHKLFKEKLADCKAVIRTGEFTPYANIILVSGVSF